MLWFRRTLRCRWLILRRRKRWIFFLFSVTTIGISLLVLHFVLLPSFTGAYNDECYLDERKLNNLRRLILVSAKLMEKYNRTYWLDFGTLLGAVKFGDVLPWDGDGDISSIFDPYFDAGEMNKEFETYGISRNALVATANGTRIDYYRWTTGKRFFNGREETLINKYYPKWIMDNENVFVKFEHEREKLPLSWIIPTKKIKFLGVPVAVPREYEKCLIQRYPFTYKYNIYTPYKWKCWLPCWLTRATNCRKRPLFIPT